MPGTGYRHLLGRLAALFAIGLIVTGPAANAAETATLDIELNGLEASKDGCTVNFVMRNGLESAIDALSLKSCCSRTMGASPAFSSSSLGTCPWGRPGSNNFASKVVTIFPAFSSTK